MNWSDYLTENYDELCKIASSLTDDPQDLVHHVYLKVVEKEVEEKDNYFRRVMWIEGTANNSKFRELYTYRDTEVAELEIISDLSDKITKERIDFMLFQFNEFQREIYELWRQGYNMSKVSRESGIPRRTIDYTISQIKEFLRSEL